MNNRNCILRWNKLAPTLRNKYADISLLKNWQIKEKYQKALKEYVANLEKQREENKKDRLAEQRNTNEQIERVRKKYYGTDKWMKAPNGNDTNLTERQWLQVRTKNFKKWFGDWEQLHTIKEVFNASPVAELTGTEFSKIEGESLVDRVVEYYNSIGGKVERGGLGSVILSKKNIQSSIAHGLGRNKAIAFKAVPDVIKNGTIISRTENSKGRGYTSYVIDAPISISGERYICEVVIKESKTSKNFYLHEVEKIRLQSDNQVRASEENSTSHNAEAKASKLIIGKLWDEVNGKTSLVVDGNGEPLVMYHGTADDFNIFDITKSGEQYGGYSSHGTGFYFTSDYKEAENYARRASNNRGGNEKVYSAFLNIRDAFKGFFSKEGFSLGEEAWENLTSNIESLSKYGYDGYFDDAYNEARYIAVATTPNQIKSATDNNGDFSIDNPDIRYQNSLGVQPREGTVSNSGLIASSYRLDTDKGKYYITDGVQKEVFSVVSATMPNATEEQLSDLRKTAVFATAFLTSLDEDIQDELVRKSLRHNGKDFLTGDNANMLRLFFNFNDLTPEAQKKVSDTAIGASLTDSAKIILVAHSNESTIVHVSGHIIYNLLKSWQTQK